jgi:hypothetical protein
MTSHNPPLLPAPSCRHVICALAIALASVHALPLAGCSSEKRADDMATLSDSVQRSADRDFTREPFKDQARQGVIRQRALFEAHFVPDSDRLSALGRRDVAVLADAMSTAGGGISLRCSSASPALFAARLATVRKSLIAAGIDPGRVVINEEMPGGPGITTEDALIIRAEIRAVPMAPISDAVVQPGAQNLQSGPTTP